MTVTVPDAEIVRAPSWDDHLAKQDWPQGDHILISAPTKAGKTTMVKSLVDRGNGGQGRSHVVMLVTKTHDQTIKREFKGWSRIHRWPPSPWEHRVLLWPKPGKTLLDTLDIQRRVFRDALDKIGRGNRDGWSGWCVVSDELHYLSDTDYVGLRRHLAMLHHVGRSAGISMVDLTQRPANVPKIIYSSVAHAYIARTRDADDLKRLSDLGGIDTKQVKDTLIRLPSRHDYLYVNAQGDALPSIVNSRM